MSAEKKGEAQDLPEELVGRGLHPKDAAEIADKYLARKERLSAIMLLKAKIAGFPCLTFCMYYCNVMFVLWFGKFALGVFWA